MKKTCFLFAFAFSLVLYSISGNAISLKSNKNTTDYSLHFNKVGISTNHRNFSFHKPAIDNTLEVLFELNENNEKDDSASDFLFVFIFFTSKRSPLFFNTPTDFQHSVLIPLYILFHSWKNFLH